MISGEARRFLLEAARAAPSADNSQPWGFRIEDNRFDCAYRKREAFDPFGAGGHATLISVGAVAENLCQLLGKGVELCLGDLAKGEPYFSLPLDAVGQLTESTVKSHPLFRRHTNRFAYQDVPLPSQRLMDLAMMREDTAKVVLLSDTEACKRYAAIAEVCCRARFCNRELHEWLMNSLRWTDEEAGAGDGLDVGTLDLPPGGRAFMRLIRPWQRVEFLNRWLGLYRMMAFTEVQPLLRAPAVACIVGKNTPTGSFSAGRLMQRLWIACNAEGWAVHPYYVVADQHVRLSANRIPAPWPGAIKTAMSDLASLVRLTPEELIHISLRVGLPKREAPKSRRLALDILSNRNTK